MSVPAHKALGATCRPKKGFVDKVNFWMHCNLHHILPSVADIFHKALTVPKADKESAPSARKRTVSKRSRGVLHYLKESALKSTHGCKHTALL